MKAEPPIFPAKEEPPPPWMKPAPIPAHWYRSQRTLEAEAASAAVAPIQPEFEARDEDLRTVLNLIFRRLDQIEKQLARQGERGR